MLRRMNLSEADTMLVATQADFVNPRLGIRSASTDVTDQLREQGVRVFRILPESVMRFRFPALPGFGAYSTGLCPAAS